MVIDIICIRFRSPGAAFNHNCVGSPPPPPLSKYPNMTLAVERDIKIPTLTYNINLHDCAQYVSIHINECFR